MMSSLMFTGNYSELSQGALCQQPPNPSDPLLTNSSDRANIYFLLSVNPFILGPMSSGTPEHGFCMILAKTQASLLEGFVRVNLSL